jgi:hypothetical protein
MRTLVLVVVVAACGDPGDPGPVRNDARTGDGATDDGGRVLDPTPGKYRLTCDGSGAVALDFTTFLDVNDENQGVRIYQRAADGPPSQVVDITAGLGLQPDDEADLEDLARIGDRVYVITSHGRNTSGKIRAARYRFAALDVTNTIVGFGIEVAGYSSKLLEQMLVAANWETPDTALIEAIDAASQLDEPEVLELAPEDRGTNIEALAVGAGGKLLIGFRNPRPDNKAIVVTLNNPAEVITGATAKFGGATTLDLGGLGLRSMTFSEAHDAVLIIAGPHNGTGPFKLYRWAGVGATPEFVTDITAPADSAPEAVVAYPGTKDVQIVFDQGDALIGGTICKEVPADSRVFTDLILHVD